MSSIEKLRPETWVGTEADPLGGIAKRAFDVLFAGIAVLSLLPACILIALAIRLAGPGPVFFLDRRVGYNGRTFRCIKFRTMYVDADERLKAILASDPEAAREYAATRKLKSDPRVIPFVGELLRGYSLDELPQFLNVLLGDMSVVGPRPVAQDELARYGPSLGAYLSARPGVTGLWQVSGRSDTSYDERVALDVQYVTNWHTLRDIRIIVATIVVVFARKGAY